VIYKRRGVDVITSFLGLRLVRKDALIQSIAFPLEFLEISLTNQPSFPQLFPERMWINFSFAVAIDLPE
jgi:hypothetical protein